MRKNQIHVKKAKKILTRVAFPLIGILSTIWFLVRVIPKPSRAGYPCMKVTFPLASTFVTYLLSLAITIFSFKKFRKYLSLNRQYIAVFFLLAGMASGLWFFGHSDISFADYSEYYITEHVANEPMGTGVGIFPGRVVWAWDSDATNENQTGTDDGYIQVSENDDYYFLIKNNDQSVIDAMMADVVLNLTGETTVDDAWEAMFKFHNMNESGKDSTYQPGEKIFIKINATSIIQGDGGESWHSWEPTELTKYKPTWWDHPDVVETTPQVVLSVLRQLINEAGVQQEDIYIGDPLKNVYKHLFNYWKAEFPNVNVLGNDVLYLGLNLASLDRVPVVKTSSEVVFYSDTGSVMDEAVSDKLYTIHEDASYMINIASLKAHACAGITLCAKNHFGSQARESAGHLHKGLIGVDNDKPVRTDHGMYRVQVDLMAHKLLGGNTILFLVDGLYSAVEGWTNAYPIKWDMAPFNGDFTNSIFASLDPVALESVCFDFLRTEYDGPAVEFNRPNMSGVDDYLEQAADPTKWPEGIVYDPENDGVPISSLGTHEHWNNAGEMKYSQNLGDSIGIELISVFGTSTSINDDQIQNVPNSFVLKQNYPNPFNSGTIISYSLSSASDITLEIFDLNGRKVRILKTGFQKAGSYSAHWDGTDQFSMPVSSGIYIYKLSVSANGKTFMDSNRMLMIK